MRELGKETISGTPGTAASLTVAAISSPIAWPRMSDVGPAGAPVHYSIENADGQPLCTGVGYSSAAGTFVRQREFSQWNGSAYSRDPATLYSLPSGCTIYCALGAVTVVPTFAPPSDVDTDRWCEPGGQVIGSTAWTPTAANRDHFWRFRNYCAFKIDAVGLYLGAAGTLDFGIYEVDWATGDPGKLLLGWQGVTTASTDNVLTLASATLGALSAAAQTLPVGDLIAMYNVDSTSVTGARTIDSSASMCGLGAISGTAAKPYLYATRTNNTTFGDSPSITGRHTTIATRLPAVMFRAV